MTRLAFIVALLVLPGCSDVKADETKSKESRKSGELQPDKIVSALKPGMLEEDVKKIIYRLRANIPIGNYPWDTSEGQVRYPLGNDACVVVQYENGRLADTEIVRFDDLKQDVEDDLFEAMRLIHRSTFVGNGYDPTSLIRAANGLLPLGKENALAALHKYHRLVIGDWDRAWRHGLDEQRLFLVARLLFVRKDGISEMPWMFIGGTGPDVRPGNRDWPLFPLAVVDDVPFSLSSGYTLAGKAQSPLAHLKFCEENCILRKKPLIPTGTPLSAAVSLMSSKRWKRLFPDPAKESFTASLIRMQAINSIKHVVNDQHKDHCHQLNINCFGQEKADQHWQRLLNEFSDSGLHWKSKNRRFEEK